MTTANLLELLGALLGVVVDTRHTYADGRVELVAHVGGGARRRIGWFTFHHTGRDEIAGEIKLKGYGHKSLAEFVGEAAAAIKALKAREAIV